MPTLTTKEFAASIKAKYPVYASVPDAELAAKMLEKYPVYRESVVDFKSAADVPQPSMLESAAGVVGDLGIGALKGMGQTATNLGEIVHMIPGVSRAVDALYGAPVSRPSFTAADEALAPTNTAQAIGKGAEQLGEFFAHGGAVKRAAQGLGLMGRAGLEAVTGAGVAAAQGASPMEMGASGALAGAPSALAPFGRKLTATMAEHLRAKAAKRVTEGLGATRTNLKLEAKRIAPEFAERKLGGTLESLSDLAKGKSASLGKEIGATVRGPAGEQRLASAPILSALEKAKSKLTTQQVETGASIVTDKAQHKALSELQDVVAEYGDEMSLAQVNALKKLYGRVTANRGGYDVKAGEILNTAPEAARTFAAILRKTENGTEALTALNKEFRFWKSLEKVATATVNRRTSQGKGLTASMAPVIGATMGAGSGDGVSDRVQNAIIGGVAGRRLTTALQSPQWKFVRARYANSLAQALAHNDPERVGQVVGKILAAEAAH